MININHGGKLWLIGGTQESRSIALEMIAFNNPCLITVTTPEARTLYPQHSCLKVVVGCLSPLKIEEFYYKHQIKGIIDASHPYASEISQLAVSLASTYDLPYLRYERPCLSEGKAIILESFDALLCGDYLLGKRVFLTIGCQGLSLFEAWQKKATLYARVLPKIESLQIALAAGFSADRLIAFRPPLDYDLERALWKHWKIEIVVSKASGQAGGEDIKQQVAQDLGIPIVIIKRPASDYHKLTHDLMEVRKFLQSFSI